MVHMIVMVMVHVVVMVVVHVVAAVIVDVGDGAYACECGRW